MKADILVLLPFAGLVVITWLVRRHLRRTPAASVRVIRTLDDLRAAAAADGITLRPPGGQAAKPDLKRLRQILRREQEKQRPWEGRN